METALIVTEQHLRELYASTVEDPVLYIAIDDDGHRSLDVWAGAYVREPMVVAHRHDVVDRLGDDDQTPDLFADMADELQATVDGIIQDL